MKAKKAVLLFLVSLTLTLSAATAAWGQPTWISFNGSAIEEKPSAVVRQSNELETLIEFRVGGVSIDEVVEGGETFHTLRLPHYHTTLEVGKPQLPALTELVAIPESANVSATVVDSSVVILKGYRVYPFQTPLLEGQERTRFDIDSALYARNRFYPENVVEVGKPSIMRDVRVVTLRVYPIRYNPATGDLEVYQNLTVKLEYRGTSDVNVLTPSGRPASHLHKHIYRNLIVNYDSLTPQEGAAAAEEPRAPDYDYLIIAVDLFVDELAPLEAWKDSQGIATQITPLSSIVPPTAQEIKDYIIEEYNDNNISYVLLVGDIAALPTYNLYGAITVSDYWYALLSGDDLLPEIAVGRFSATLESDVTNMVNKSVNFEDNPSGDWLDKALLVAHKQGAPGKYEGCKEEIDSAADTSSHTYRAKYPDFDHAYGSSGATNQSVIDAIDEGRLVVNYRGHGGPTSWSTWNTGNESFDTTDVAALDNAERTPVVFGIACLNNQLDFGGDCLGESFTKADDAAAAYLGASSPSYTVPNHTYDKQLFATIFDEGTENIGNASNIAAVRMMNSDGRWGEDNAKMYLWLGDPSLAIPLGSMGTYYWLILVDTSGSMAGERIETARSWAIEIVNSAMATPSDQVALASFNGDIGYSLLIDWTRDGAALIAAIEGLTTGGMTPLADAACAAADKLIDAVGDPNARRLALISDGDENDSTGPCSGPPDDYPDPPTAPWCTDGDSWHCKVWTKLVDNVIVDVGYFGNLGATMMAPEESEGVGDVSLDAESVELFLQDLTEETGGEYYDPVGLCGDGILDFGEQCDVGYPCAGTDDGASWQCTNCQCVLAVTLLEFTGTVSSGNVVLSWKTESELNNEGFNILRSTDPNGPYERVNASIVPAEGGPAFGVEYEFVDENAEAGVTYYYKLEDIDTSGVSTFHGADACTFGSDPDCEPLAVTVPGLSAADFCADHEIRSSRFWTRWADRWACVFADWKDNETDLRFPNDCKIARDQGSRSLACVATENAD